MQQYSFLNILVLINGIPLTGWSEGDDVIEVQRREDAFMDQVGADGRMIGYQNANRSGSLTFRLQQQSEGNLLMSNFFGIQEGQLGQYVPINVTMKNIASGEMAQGTFGYVTKPAEMRRGTGVNSQEWTVVVEQLDQLFGPLPGL